MALVQCQMTLFPCVMTVQQNPMCSASSLPATEQAVQGRPALNSRPTRLLRKLFKGQFSKTRMCFAFEKGQCEKGPSCAFAHDESELKPAPDLHKTSCCKKFQEGTCKRSKEECHFAHGLDDLRVTSAQAPVAPSAEKFCQLAGNCTYDATPTTASCMSPGGLSSIGGMDFFGRQLTDDLSSPSCLQATPSFFGNQATATTPMALSPTHLAMASCCSGQTMPDAWSRQTTPATFAEEFIMARDALQKASAPQEVAFLDLLKNVSKQDTSSIVSLLNSAVPECYED